MYLNDLGTVAEIDTSDSCVFDYPDRPPETLPPVDPPVDPPDCYPYCNNEWWPEPEIPPIDPTIPPGSPPEGILVNCDVLHVKIASWVTAYNPVALNFQGDGLDLDSPDFGVNIDAFAYGGLTHGINPATSCRGGACSSAGEAEFFMNFQRMKINHPGVAVFSGGIGASVADPLDTVVAIQFIDHKGLLLAVSENVAAKKFNVAGQTSSTGYSFSVAFAVFPNPYLVWQYVVATKILHLSYPTYP